MKLTAAELAALVLYGGWSGESAVTMTAIGLAEHRGSVETSAESPPYSGGGVANTIDVGVFSIQCVGCYGAGISEQDERLKDPFTNARAAFTKYRAQGFNAWCVWEPSACGGNGSQLYRDYISEARTAMGTAKRHRKEITDRLKKRAEDEGIGVEDIPGVSAVTGAVSNIVDVVTDPEFWLRTASVIMGIALVVIAVVRVSR